MKNLIIGIAGSKNSGKDTVANMINYILSVGIANAKYIDWLTKRNITEDKFKERIYHFADPLKEVLSIMYNIPIQCFYDREYKDNRWYCIETNSFIDSKKAEEKYPNDNFIRIADLQTGMHLTDWIYESTINNCRTFIKLRTLLQYFGTDICRRYLANGIWIKAAMAKIIDKAETFKYCLVPDVRYENEANAINVSTDSLYGQVIAINRKSETADSHTSEQIDFEADYYIDNNSTLTALFYQVLNIIVEIYENNRT